MSLFLRCMSLLAILATLVGSAVCSRPPWRTGPARAQPALAQSGPSLGQGSERAASASAVEPTEPTARPGASPKREASPGKAASGAAASWRSIEYQFTPDAVRYYVIENEIRDSARISGVFSLGYTTVVRDRRSIIQRVQLPTTRQAAGPATSAPERNVAAVNCGAGGGAAVSWECDRYEITEERTALEKDQISFDSLRDSYPPPSLRELGGIPGSIVSFCIEPGTGEVSRPAVTPGTIAGPPSGKKLSGTAKKCSLTNASLQSLLDLLGPYYLPSGPVQVGEQWSRTHHEVLEVFGPVVTEITCLLRGVREEGGRDIATIEIAGVISLEAKETPKAPEAKGAQTNPVSRQAATKPVASRPQTNPRPASAGSGQPTPHGAQKSKPRDLNLEKHGCSGTVEFDLTRGKLVEMTLRWELEGVATAESGKAATTRPGGEVPTEIRTGTSRVLRVRGTDAPPPKPVIVGGPKPPAVSAEDLVPERPAQRRWPTSSPATTLRAGPTTRGTATRPSMTPPASTTRPYPLPNSRPTHPAAPRPVAKPQGDTLPSGPCSATPGFGHRPVRPPTPPSATQPVSSLEGRLLLPARGRTMTFG